AVAGGHMPAGAGIEQGLAVDDDMAALRPPQPGNRLHDRALAGTRGAEQSDDAAPLRPEVRIKGETAKLMADGDVQCHWPASRWARRAKISDSTSPERASAIDNAARRAAAASLPGVWIAV